MSQATVETHLQQGQLALAQDAADAWGQQEPASLLALQYRGLTRLWQGEAAAAEECFRAALAKAPELPRNRANLAITLLTLGRYREGLPLYEARYAGIAAHDSVAFPGLDPARQWRGEPLAGQRLLLVREQGLGDQIQFIRFAATLRARGAVRVIATAHSRLLPLLDGVAGLDHATDGDVSSDDYDCWSPLLSVPLRLGVEGPIPPAQQPYLQVPEERVLQWRRLIDGWAHGKPRIGVVWAGSPGNAIDARRSLSLPHMLHMLEARGRSVAFSLQMGDAGMDQLERQCRAGLIPLLDMQRDLADAAAILCQMDLVISVDTAIAHLAGALGKPTWLLLSRGADWRWGQTGEQTPWYPSLRLFRQRESGDWGPVLAAVRQALAT